MRGGRGPGEEVDAIYERIQELLQSVLSILKTLFIYFSDLPKGTYVDLGGEERQRESERAPPWQMVMFQSFFLPLALLPGF